MVAGPLVVKTKAKKLSKQCLEQDIKTAIHLIATNECIAKFVRTFTLRFRGVKVSLPFAVFASWFSVKLVSARHCQSTLFKPSERNIADLFMALDCTVFWATHSILNTNPPKSFWTVHYCPNLVSFSHLMALESVKSWFKVQSVFFIEIISETSARFGDEMWTRPKNEPLTFLSGLHIFVPFYLQCHVHTGRPLYASKTWILERIGWSSKPNFTVFSPAPICELPLGPQAMYFCWTKILTRKLVRPSKTSPQTNLQQVAETLTVCETWSNMARSLSFAASTDSRLMMSPSRSSTSDTLVAVLLRPNEIGLSGSTGALLPVKGGGKWMKRWPSKFLS